MENGCLARMNLIGTRGKPETVSGVPLKGLKQGECSGSNQAWFPETLSFGLACASDGKKNWKMKRESEVVDKEIAVLFVIDTNCEIRKVNDQC
jgi:hypothetical protein